VTRVHVLCEGQTEETFTRRVLAPDLAPRGVYLYPQLFGGRGGDIRWPRIRKDILAILRSDRGARCTTFIDYYGRGRGFPGEEETRRANTTVARKQALEAAMMADIAQELGAHEAQRRFLPYVQMYEFEALLFVGARLLALVIEVNNDVEDSRVAQQLQAVRDAFASPEDINDSPTTAPSKRILAVCPSYRKVFDGTRVASQLTIAAIRRECALFDAWVGRLEALSAGPGV
jgi:hypothetical protein